MAKSPDPAPPGGARVFVSYARRSRGEVVGIVETLRKESFDVFWDWHTDAGEDWQGRLGREIDNCAMLLVVWARDSIDSPYVRWELEEARRLGRRIIQCRIENVAPTFLTEEHATDLINWGGNRNDEIWRGLIHVMGGGADARPDMILPKRHITADERDRWSHLIETDSPTELTRTMKRLLAKRYRIVAIERNHVRLERRASVWNWPKHRIERFLGARVDDHIVLGDPTRETVVIAFGKPD